MTRRRRRRIVPGIVKAGIAAATLAAFGSAAFGTEGWEPLGTEGRVVYRLGRAAARPGPASIATVTLRRDFPDAPVRNPSRPGAVELDCSGRPLPRSAPHAISHALDTVEFDCRGNRYRFTEIAILGREGAVLHRFRPVDQLIPLPSSGYLATAAKRACR